MVEAKKVYLCPFCEGEHDTWEEASDCRMTCEDDQVKEQWQCSDCDELYDTEKEAENCCKEDVV